MTPQEALLLLERGAANLIDWTDQAKRAYHVQVQEAVKILTELLPKKSVEPEAEED